MIDKNRLKTLTIPYGIQLSDEMLRQLDMFAELLLEWNKKINLTAITEPEEIEAKHFLDSLLLAKQPLLQGTVADVGSGAGFPGLILKIYRPELGLVLIEPTGKRVNFLSSAARLLGLDIEVVKGRAEELARKAWRERYGVVVARAVAAMPLLCEYCLPLVRSGGVFIAMKGDAAVELAQAGRALKELGGVLGGQEHYTLPGGQQRSLIFVEKVRKTPQKYPRNGGVIAKRPLIGQ